MRSSIRLFDSRNQGGTDSVYNECILTLISSSIQFRIALRAVDGSRGIDLHLRVLILEINGFSEFSRSFGSSLAVEKSLLCTMEDKPAFVRMLIIVVLLKAPNTNLTAEW